MNNKIYEFGEYRLDLHQKQLLQEGENIPLPPKVFELLTVLVENHGKLVSRDELMETVWRETFVEESSLRFCIHSLRKALNTKNGKTNFIETVPKRGYRFNAEVKIFSSEERQVFSPDDNLNENGEIKQPLIDESSKTAQIPARSSFQHKFEQISRLQVLLVTILALSFSVILVFIGYNFYFSTSQNSFRKQTLLVLPFKPSSESKINELGLADELISALSQIKHLKVFPIEEIGFSASQSNDLSTAKRKLKADFVLEGSYRVENENVRIITRLLRSVDDEILWTQTFLESLANPFELERIVSLKTAGSLATMFSQIEEENSLQAKNLNPEALQSYLTGRKIWRSRENQRRQEMIGLFEKAIVHEPNWALAHAGLAIALLNDDRLLDDWNRAEISVQKALELDNSLPEAHTVLGQIYYLRDWNWEKAEREFKTALALNPNYAPAYLEYGMMLGIQRRFIEAESSIKKAIELEPFSPFNLTALCEVYRFDRRYEKALAQCLDAQRIDPEFWRTRKQLFWIYAENKMYDKLEELVLRKLSPAKRAAHPLEKALKSDDMRIYWQDAIDEKLRNENHPTRQISLAYFYLQIGENERALQHLETASKERHALLPPINADPVFNPVRSDRRFVDIMEKIGLSGSLKVN